MTDDRGTVSIDSLFLQNNYLFALRFADEKYVFGRVLGNSHLQYKPYDQLGLLAAGSNSMSFPTALFASGTNAISPDNTAKTDVMLATNRSNADQHDILYISKKGPQFLYGAMGIKPSYVEVYSEYIQGSTIMGNWPVTLSPNAAIGDPFARFNGLDSPYEAPTNFREYAIPPAIHLSFQFYLPSRFDPVQPQLNLRFQLIDAQFFDINGKGYEKTLIQGIATRKMPAAYLTMGPEAEPLSYDKASESYKVPAINLDMATGAS